MKKNRQNKVELLNEHDIGHFQKNESIATIYIGNLVYSINEDDLKSLFSKHGVVTYVRLMKDQETLRSKGFAFVQMNNKNDAKQAVNELNGMQHLGRTLKASFAKESVSVSSVQTRRPQLSRAEKEIEQTEPKQYKKKPKRKKGLDLLFNHLQGK